MVVKKKYHLQTCGPNVKSSFTLLPESTTPGASGVVTEKKSKNNYNIESK